MAAPVLQDLTITRGRLTMPGSGDVPLADCMLVSDGGAAITGWTVVATNDPSLYWDVASTTMTPVPTTAGNTAGLPGGPYTFTVTATNASGTSASKTLTINMAANTYTISKPLDITSTSIGLRKTSVRQGLGGKTVAFARYGTNNWASPAIAQFNGFKDHNVGTRFTITSEDPANPSIVRRIDCIGMQRVDWVDLDCSNTLDLSNTSSNLQNTQLMMNLRYTATFGVCSDITFTRVRCYSEVGSATNQWVTAFGVDSSDSLAIPQVSNLTFTDCRATRVKDGWRMSNIQDVTVTRPVVDSFCSNAHFYGGRLNNISRDGAISVRAYINLCDLADHCDFGQIGSVNTAQDVDNITITREFASVANGNKGAQGTPFVNDIAYTGGAPTGFFANNITITNILCVTPAHNGFTSDAGTGWLGQRTSYVRGYGSSALVDPNGNQYSGVGFSGPDGAEEAGMRATGTFSNNVAVYAWPEALLNWPTLGSDNIVLNLLSPAPSPWTEADRSSYLAPYFNAPGTVIDYANLTAEQIKAAETTAYAAKLNGPLKNSIGTYQGALFPNGTWNDGTIYNAAPTTTYTSSAQVPSVTVGEPVTITLQLDATAAQTYTFTPHLAGVSGGFDPPTVQITAGNATAQIVFTPTTAGSASVTFTNSSTLINPVALIIAVAAAPAGPTLYTQSANHAVVSIGNSVQIDYALDLPATVDVTITPASTISGNFTPTTVVIPFGQTAGFTVFIPSISGVSGTLTATNDKGLANPSALPLTVSSSAATIGGLLKYGIHA